MTNQIEIDRVLYISQQKLNTFGGKECIFTLRGTSNKQDSLEGSCLASAERCFGNLLALQSGGHGHWLSISVLRPGVVWTQQNVIWEYRVMMVGEWCVMTLQILVEHFILCPSSVYIFLIFPGKRQLWRGEVPKCWMQTYVESFHVSLFSGITAWLNQSPTPLSIRYNLSGPSLLFFHARLLGGYKALCT